MKPSAAIRKGILRDGPQAFGHEIVWDHDVKKPIMCCAMGAMILGAAPSVAAAYKALEEEGIPSIDYLRCRGVNVDVKISVLSLNPCLTERLMLTLDDAVIMLNDDYEWTRGRIARWLESIGY